jgi:hypothetical protein
MKNPLESFFEYVAVREQRERLMTRLTAIAVVIAVGYTLAVIIYLAAH